MLYGEIYTLEQAIAKRRIDWETLTEREVAQNELDLLKHVAEQGELQKAGLEVPDIDIGALMEAANG